VDRMDNFITLFVTAPNPAEAETISNGLLQDHLIGCATIIPEIQSHYRWEGKLCRDKEVLIIMKSRREHLDAIISKVKNLHSYDVPEIIAMPIIGGSREYLTWLSETT